MHGNGGNEFGAVNVCRFSPCRRYRYRLDHDFDPLFKGTGKRIVWIGLNPSTADENNLDPTLRRIAEFSRREGFSGFTMLNLFAWRATEPKDMLAVCDPIGPDNNAVLIGTCSEAAQVVFAWGGDGGHMHRDCAVIIAIYALNVPVSCLGLTEKSCPKHPLYLPKETPLLRLA